MAILARSKVSLWFVFAIVIICRADDVLWRRWLPHDFYENLDLEVYDNIGRSYPRTFDNNELEYGYVRSDLDFNEGDIETGIVRSIEGDIGVNADSGVKGIVGGHSVPSTSDRGSFSEIMSSLLSGAGDGSVSASIYGGGGADSIANANSGGLIDQKVSGGDSNTYDGNTIVTQEGNGGISNAQTFVWKGVNGITAPNSLNGGSIFWPKSSGGTSNVNGGNIVVEQGSTSSNIYGDISSLGQGRIIVDNSKNTKFGTNLFWRGSDGIILPIYFSNGNSQGVNGDKVSNTFDGNIVVHPGIVVGQMGNSGINNNGGKTIVTQGTSDTYRGGYIVVHGGKGGTSNAHGSTLIVGQGGNGKISNVHGGGSFGIQEGNAGTFGGQDGTIGNYKGNGGGIIVGHGGSGSTSANSNDRGIYVVQGGKDGNYNGIGGGIIVGQGGSGSTSTNNNGGGTSTGQGGTVGNYNVNGGGIIVGHGGSIIVGQGGSGDTSKNNNGGGTTTGHGGTVGNYNGNNGGGIIVGQGGSGVISTNNNGGGTIVVHDGKGDNSNGNGIGIIVGKGGGMGTSPINYGTIIGHGGSGSTSTNKKGGGSMFLHINDEGHSNPYGGQPSINIDASQGVNGGYSGGGSVLGQGGSGGTSSIATSTYPYGYHNSKFVWNGVNGPNHQNAYNEAAMFGQNNLVNVGHPLLHPVITNSGPVMTGGGSTTIVSGGLPGNYDIQGVSGVMGGAGGKGYDGGKIGGSVGFKSIGGAAGLYGGVLGNGLYGGISANSNEIGGAAEITIDGNVASGGGMYGGASSAALAGGQIGGAIGGYAGGGLGVTYGGGVGGYGLTPVTPASYTYMYGRK